MPLTSIKAIRFGYLIIYFYYIGASDSSSRDTQVGTYILIGRKTKCNIHKILCIFYWVGIYISSVYRQFQNDKFMISFITNKYLNDNVMQIFTIQAKDISVALRFLYTIKLEVSLNYQLT